MTRVAIDGSSITAHASGARTRFLNLLSAYGRLADRPAAVALVTERTDLAAPLRAAGLEVEIVPEPPGPAWRLLRGASFPRRRLDALHADLFQAETLPVPRAGSLPLLLTIHDLRDLAPPTPLLAPRRLYASLVLPAALRRVARVIAVSRDTAAHVARLGVPAERLVVIPNAPDPAAIRPPPAGEVEAVRRRLGLPARFVLALGHLEPRKGLGLLVEAMRRMRADPAYGDVALVLAGRAGTGGGAAGEVERLRAAAERAPRVPLLLPGPVVDAERAVLLATAAVVAVPSRVEGFGLVPLEALAHGTPVVASARGALPEVLGDAATLVAGDDPQAFAAALAAALERPATARAEQAARGRARARAWSWHDAAVALCNLHLEVLDGPRGRRSGQ